MFLRFLSSHSIPFLIEIISYTFWFNHCSVNKASDVFCFDWVKIQSIYSGAYRLRHLNVHCTHNPIRPLYTVAQSSLSTTGGAFEGKHIDAQKITPFTLKQRFEHYWLVFWAWQFSNFALLQLTQDKMSKRKRKKNTKLAMELNVHREYCKLKTMPNKVWLTANGRRTAQTHTFSTQSISKCKNPTIDDNDWRMERWNEEKKKKSRTNWNEITWTRFNLSTKPTHELNTK